MGKEFSKREAQWSYREYLEGFTKNKREPALLPCGVMRAGATGIIAMDRGPACRTHSTQIYMGDKRVEGAPDILRS